VEQPGEDRARNTLARLIRERHGTRPVFELGDVIEV
jgi:hypothetical protein